MKGRLAVTILIVLGLLGLMALPYAPLSLLQSSTLPVSFSFAAAGDFGNSWNGTGETRRVVQGIAGSGVDFAIALGDLAYTDDASVARAWCGTFKSAFNNVVVISGNHDSGESSVGPMDVYEQACPFPLAGVSLIQGTIQDEHGTGYGYEYAFDYPASNPIARFILIVPNIYFRCCGLTGKLYTYNKGTPNYSWVSDRIDEAKARGEWVIVGWHIEPLSSAHIYDIGSDVWGLMFQKKVDLVIVGHDHVFERTYQLKCGIDVIPCIANTDPNTYEPGPGPVLVIQGTGGRPLFGVSQDPVFVMGAQNNTQHGFVKYTVSSGALAGQFVSTEGSFADRFSITASTSLDLTLSTVTSGSARTVSTSKLDLWPFASMLVGLNDRTQGASPSVSICHVAPRVCDN